MGTDWIGHPSDYKNGKLCSGRANKYISMNSVWLRTCIKKINQVHFYFILTLIWPKSCVCSIRFALAQTLSAKKNNSGGGTFTWKCKKVTKTIYTNYDLTNEMGTRLLKVQEWNTLLVSPVSWPLGVSQRSWSQSEPDFIRLWEWFGHGKATSDCFWRGMR